MSSLLSSKGDHDSLTASALLLGQEVALANPLKSMTDPQWQITVDGILVHEGTFGTDQKKITTTLSLIYEIVKGVPKFTRYSLYVQA